MFKKKYSKKIKNILLIRLRVIEKKTGGWVAEKHSLVCIGARLIVVGVGDIEVHVEVDGVLSQEGVAHVGVAGQGGVEPLVAELVVAVGVHRPEDGAVATAARGAHAHGQPPGRRGHVVHGRLRPGARLDVPGLRNTRPESARKTSMNRHSPTTYCRFQAGLTLSQTLNLFALNRGIFLSPRLNLAVQFLKNYINILKKYGNKSSTKPNSCNFCINDGNR